MIKNKLYLLFVFLIYSIALLFAKYASIYTILDYQLYIFYILELIVLLIYAILWQRALKYNKLNIAYLFKSSTILYSTLFGIILFDEVLTIFNIIAITFIFIGIYMVNAYE